MFFFCVQENWLLITHTVSNISVFLTISFIQEKQNALVIELGGTETFKTVLYFIKYHGINNYCSI